MPSYKIEIPGQGSFNVDSPTELTDDQAYRAVQQQLQIEAQPQTAGIGEALKGGTKRLIESIRTGIEAPFIGGEEAATKGLARQEAITERPAASLDEIKRIYEQKGLLPAAKEAVSQLPASIAEQAPFIGTMIGGARLGSMAGSAFGPVGTVVGGLAGAAISPFLSAAGSNIERQAQEDLKSGKPISIDRTRAYLTAIPQAALDVGAMEIGLGRALGISKMGTEAAEKMATESLKKSIAIGIGKTALAEVPTEVIQQMLERSQAGLSLTTPDAVKEYKDTAYQAVLLSPLGSAARIVERGEAKQKVEALANLGADQQRAYEESIRAEQVAKLKNDVEEMQRQKAIQDAILPPEQYKLLAAPKQEPIVATSTEALGTEKQIEEYLKTVPEDQQVAERARLMGMAPQPIQSIISDTTLQDLGIGKSAIIRKNGILQNLDLTNPEKAQEAVDILTAYKDTTGVNKNTKAKVEEYIANIPNLIEAAKNERLVTAGSRDNLQVSGQPVSGEVSPTAQGELGNGVTDLADVTGRLEGRTEAQPAALAPETTEVMKSAEELAPTTEKKIEDAKGLAKELGGESAQILQAPFDNPGYNYTTKDEVEVTFRPEGKIFELVPGDESTQVGSDVHLDYIGSKIKNQGLASKELDRIIKKADQNNLSLSIEVAKQDEEGLSNAQLKKWYERKGFIFPEGYDSEVGYRPRSDEDISQYQQKTIAVADNKILPIQNQINGDLRNRTFSEPDSFFGHYGNGDLLTGYHAVPSYATKFDDIYYYDGKNKPTKVGNLKTEYDSALRKLIVGRIGAKESRTESATTGSTVADIISALKQEFGNIMSGINRGLINIQSTTEAPKEIRDQIGPTTKALFYKDKVYIFNDRTTPNEAKRDLLHELGAHYGLQGMLGKAKFKEILQLLRQGKISNPEIKAVWERTRKVYPDIAESSDLYAEEVLARLSETAPNNTLVRRVMGYIKQFLTKLGFGWNTDKITPNDIRDMVQHSVRLALRNKIKPSESTIAKESRESREIDPEYQGTSIFAPPKEKEGGNFKEHVEDFKNFKFDKDTREDLFLKGRIKVAYSGAGVQSKLMDDFNGAVSDALKGVRADVLMSQALNSNILGSESAKTGYVDFDDLNVARVISNENNLANINEEISKLSKQIGPENAKHVTQAYLLGLRYQYELDENNRLETQAKKEESEGKKATAAKTREGKTKITEEQQAAIPEALSYGEKYSEVKRVAEMYKVFNDNDTNMLEKAGIYSKDQAERYRKTRGYVPLFRLMDEMERSNPGARQFFRGFADVGREYAFEGSERQVLDVFDNMLTRHMWAVNAAVRNKANQQVAKQLAVRNENNKVELHEYINPEKIDRMAPVFVNGRRKFVEYTDPNFAIAIHGAEPALGPILGMFGTASRALRIGVTSLPPFQVYQVFNDATRAAMLSGVKSPFKLMARVIGSFGTILKDQTNDPISIEMRRLGISGGYGHTALEVSDKMRRDLNLKTNTLMKQALDKAEKFAAASDMAQRRAIYIQTLLESGGTQNPDGSISGGNKVLAMHRAMDIINWQKHGTSGKLRILAQVVPFMNAYIQGMDVLIGAMRGKAISGTAKKEAQALFLQTAIKIAALSMLYSMLIADDEEYQKLDDRTKVRSFIIPGAGVKIPVSAEVALLTKAIPELMYQYITREGTASPMDATKLRNELGVALLDGLLGPNLLPQIARPTLEAITNYNFLTGSPLVGRGLENLRTSDQFTENTSELAKLIGKSGIISPLKIDHLMKGYGGTAVSGVLYGTDAIANVFYEDKLPTTPLHKVPSIGSFFYNPNGKDQLNDYYDLKDRVAEVVTTYNRLVKFGHQSEALEYAQENKEMLSIKTQVNAINTNMTKLRDFRKAVINSNISSDAKRDQLDKIDLQINAMVKNIGMLRVQAGL